MTDRLCGREGSAEPSPREPRRELFECMEKLKEGSSRPLPPPTAPAPAAPAPVVDSTAERLLRPQPPDVDVDIDVVSELLEGSMSWLRSHNEDSSPRVPD